MLYSMVNSASYAQLKFALSQTTVAGQVVGQLPLNLNIALHCMFSALCMNGPCLGLYPCQLLSIQYPFLRSSARFGV